MSRVVLVQASPRLATTGAVSPVRLAGGGSRAFTHLGFADWLDGVMGEPLFTAQLGFDKDGFSSAGIPQTAAIGVATTSAARAAALAGLVWPQASITVLTGDDAAAAPAWTTRLTGKVAGVTEKGGVLSLTVADLAAALNQPLCATPYAGTGGLEGGASLKGQVKRRSWGRVFSIEAGLADAAYNIYEFGDPAFPLQGFVAVKDRGLAGPMTLVPWAGSADATLAALVASKPPTSGASIAPSIARVKWWRQPSGPLTADILGEIGAGYVETAPAIAARLAAVAGGMAADALPAAVAARPDPAGCHVSTATETAAAALLRTLLGASMTWSISSAGTLQFLPIGFDNPVELVDFDSVERVETYPTVTSVTLAYAANNRVHTDAEISAAVLASDVAGLGPLATIDAVDFATQVTGTTKPANNATNSADPNSPFGTGTVGGAAQAITNAGSAAEQAKQAVRDAVGQFNQGQRDLSDAVDQLRSKVDKAGGGYDDTVVKAQLVSLEASRRGAGTSNPNLVYSPQFADSTLGAWNVGAGRWSVITGYDRGPFAQCGDANGYLWQDVPVFGGALYSLSGEMDPDQANACYLKVDWFNGNSSIPPGSQPVYADEWARGYTADNALKAPGSATKARVYCVVGNANVTSRFNRIQFQRGGVPSAFRDDGTAFYNAAKFKSEVELRDNQAGNYASQFTSLVSQFAGSQASWLKSQIEQTNTVATDNYRTVSESIGTLRSSIGSLSSPNLIANGSFTNGFSGWEKQGNRANSWNIVDQYSPVFAQSDANDYSSLYTYVSGIVPNANYCFGFESDNNTTGDNNCYMCLRWYDGNGNQIGGDINGQGAGNHRGWGNRISNGPYRAPANVAKARVEIYLSGSGTQTRRVSRFQLQQSDTPTAYSDAASFQAMQAQVTTQANTLADIQKNKLAAYFSVIAQAGNNTAYVSVFANNGQGGLTSGVILGGNVYVDGNLTLAGSLKTGAASVGAWGKTAQAANASAIFGQGMGNSSSFRVDPETGEKGYYQDPSVSTRIYHLDFSLDFKADVNLSHACSMDMPSGSRTWRFDVYLDGQPINSKGGSAFLDLVGLRSLRTLNQGSHSVDVYFSGQNSGVYVSNSTLVVDSRYNYSNQTS